MNVNDKVIIEVTFKATGKTEEREAIVIDSTGKRFTAIDSKGSVYTFQNGKPYNMSENVYLYSYK